jgi:hypothetical protein
MFFSIDRVTPSRIDMTYNGERYTVHGEALDKDVGGLDFVVNASDLHYTDSSRESVLIPAPTKVAVLDQLKGELSRRGWAFEVDGEAELRAIAASQGRVASLAAGQRCTQAGYWFTPASVTSRRKFQVGEIMPAVTSDYGATIWQWDEQQ